MRTGRKADELRPLSITPGVAKFAAGSARIELGDTHVLCTASLVNGVPAWLRGSGRGWLTAEYSMLPGATPTRTPREAVRGRQSGRTMEIQRLIGRSLRAVVDFGIIGERTIAVDCDVLQADGGTRTASISGAYVAVHEALRTLQQMNGLAQLPLFDSVAAVSVGYVDGRLLLDLDYEEDAAAEVDTNVVVTGDGRLVEVQATAEGEPFPREMLDEMLGLAAAGAAAIAAAQAAAVAELD
ncbi:MAG TPA: ribonuclease PH [Thermoleophilia bacterium]|nr:ribonuclease PH [Thermoleophilia bacterium]HQG03766.1 ribonuclease PH [Thermoleophilia bacterium]HQG54609.1 ribonuclease PH [Thermoleophilia bacterium]HQJ97721.1 ribonuclease PH [Thermoleophilia bacterium]